MRFSALVVIGNNKGRYGYGMGKSAKYEKQLKKPLQVLKRN